MNNKNSINRNIHVSRDWPVFAERLAGVLSEMCEDQFLVISEKHSSRFVQFAAQGSFGVRAEISSNAYLSQSDRLTDSQTAQLVEAGWRAPTGTPHQSTPERDPDGSPNFFIDFPAPIEAARIAGQAVVALSKIVRIPHPGFLEYKAYDTDDNALVFSQLGIKRFEKAEQTDLGKIARRLLSALKEITDIENLYYDEDGDIGLRFGSIATFICVSGNPPAIRFYSPLVQDVRETHKLHVRLNELNSGIGCMHLFVRDKTIYAMSEIAAWPLQYAVLENAVSRFCTVADGIDELLEAEFGGKATRFSHIRSTMIH